jgi:flagellar basal-body rod protein FlgB
MSEKMAYLGQRQAILAQNVANANTPGYKAKDLEPFTFEAAVKHAAAGTMAVTDAKHIVPAEMAGVNAKSKKVRGYETLPTKNDVELEQQAMKVSQTAIEYQSMVAVYKKVSNWFRSAVGKGSGA